MNEKRKLELAERLAKIYFLTGENPRLVDAIEKNFLYELAFKYPEIHYLARKILINDTGR